jgi:hypothetical protein
LSETSFAAIVEAALKAISATDLDAQEEELEGLRAFGSPAEWWDFVDRVVEGRARASSVLIFPFADNVTGGLNLSGDARLLEKMYCFHDPEAGAPTDFLVVVHVHTLRTWGERTMWAAKRLDEATSVNIRHAKRGPDGKWKQERGKFYVVPKSTDLNTNWRSFVAEDKKCEIVWNPYDSSSLPHGDQGEEAEYLKVREIIKVGDSLCHSTTLSYSLRQTQTTMRGGTEVEYEVVGVADNLEQDADACVWPSQHVQAKAPGMSEQT